MQNPTEAAPVGDSRPDDKSLTHPAWCDPSCCGRGGGTVHESAEHPVPVARGRIVTWLSHEFNATTPPLIVLTAAEWPDSGDEFLEMTLDQAAYARDLLDTLIAQAGGRSHTDDVGEAFRLGATIYRDKYIRAAAKAAL